MAGTVDLLQRCYSGLELRGKELHFHVVLPDELDRLSFQLLYRRHSLSVDVTPTTRTIASDSSGAEAISIAVDDQTFVLQPGAQRPFRWRKSGKPTGAKLIMCDARQPRCLSIICRVASLRQF